MNNSAYAIEAVGISKSFGGVRALKSINFQARRGSIHCLVGENGAGKSTLMKIFSGVLHKDAGKTLVDGREMELASPKDSSAAGIGIIYQEFVLAPDLSVAENIFLSDLAPGGFFIRWKELNRKAAAIIHDFGFTINPRTPVRKLSVAYMQIVEIAKALAKNVRVLILDEPTAVLSEPEIQVLFRVLRRLKESGVTIVYISHRLEEVFEIADAITVIKDGESILTRKRDSIDRAGIIHAMTGRDMQNLFPPRRPRRTGSCKLVAKQVAQREIIRGVSLELAQGEIVGIAGLVGSGRSEFARTLFGIDRLTAGEIEVDAKPARIRTPREAMRHGIGLVPENRKDQGLILRMSVAENLTQANLPSVTRRLLFINRAEENRVTDDYVRRLRIKRNQNADPVGSLSGGNQQKVVLAKWLHSGCRFLILDEPTRGVDVGAKYEIYDLIQELAAGGYGILVISSEMLEIIGLCDRAYVFSEGRVTGCLTGGELTEKNIMQLAIPSRESVM